MTQKMAILEGGIMLKLVVGGNCMIMKIYFSHIV